MDQKERLDLIKRKHEKERQKRKILLHRVFVGVLIVVIAIILIFSIKGCVSYISNVKEQKQLQEQQTPVPQITPIPTLSTEISNEYYSNSAFVGNSFIDGMILYSFFDNVDYFSKVGLTVNGALTEPTSTGTVPVIDELNNGKSYNKIFMLFGENELGWDSKDTFLAQYGTLIDKARQYQPSSKIYLLNITPVTKAVSDKNENNINNDSIREMNELIKQLAQDKGAVYVDIYSAVVGEDGTLPDGAASDGVHFGEEYYKKCLLYIQNNIQ